MSDERVLYEFQDFYRDFYAFIVYIFNIPNTFPTLMFSFEVKEIALSFFGNFWFCMHGDHH